ncbi:MAG: hypothetical protein CMJ72_00450 [Planctomycetaceae bacterium]|jgi:hypothetical protein|nr:hypothetical protein [Planctomycetaceae bacterium]|tara:strand:+ start:161 stop:406 length:246 start_codon:yes stop_codon:yes gene_type:complete
MWVTIAIISLIGLLLLLVWQRWKVSSEWIQMERQLSEEQYEIWKQQKYREAENWSARWKGVESVFLIILSLIMFGLWFLIP